MALDKPRPAAFRPLFRRAAKRYLGPMRHALTSPATRRAATVVLGVGVFAAATGLAFAGWMDHGAGIFLAMAESGLAWCF